MTGLTTDDICSACRIFLGMAYPAGEQTVPEKRRLYANLPGGHQLAEYHAQNPFPTATFQVLTDKNGGLRGYAFRLGSAHFPHVKLKVQWCGTPGNERWIFAVDTHDAFCQDSRRPPPNHPDAEVWSQLQRANGELKEKIERAWETVGILTFNALLREELDRPETSPPLA